MTLHRKLKKKPKAIQQDSLDWQPERKDRLYLMERGSGKCFAALVHAVIHSTGRILCVVPKTLIGTWQKEINKFTTLSSSPCLGPPKRRLDTFTKGDQDITLINPQALVALRQHGILDHAHRYGAIILDELDQFRRNSKHTQVLKELCRIIPIRIGLGEDLVVERLIDAFYPSLIINQGKLFGHNFYTWRDRWFTQEGHDWIPVDGAVEALSTILRDHAFFAQLPMGYLPIKHFEERMVSLTQIQRDMLRSLEDEWELSTETGTRWFNYRTSVLEKQHQISSGFYYDRKGNPVYFEKNYKLQETRHYIEQIRPRPFVCFYSYHAETPLLKAVFDGCGLKLHPEEEHHTWNESNADVILSSLHKSKGKNLQRAHHAFFYSRTWNYAQWSQALGRICREGSMSKDCTYTYLSSKTKIETLIAQLIHKKTDLNEYLKTLMKEPHGT